MEKSIGKLDQAITQTIVRNEIFIILKEEKKIKWQVTY